jgi:hypothetical protein
MVAQPLVIDHQVPDFDRQLLALPPAFPASSLFAISLLEDMKHMSGARCSPSCNEAMIMVAEGASAADRNQSGIARFGHA